MKTLDLIKATFKEPQLLIEARKKRGIHVFLYMLLLSLILSIPVVFHSMGLLSSLKNDGEKIVEKIPEFTIKDNKLTTSEKESGFIYQTNSMIFTFDPEGKRNKSDIEADAGRGILTMALLQNEAILILPTAGSTADVLDSNTIALPYSTPQLNNINREFISKVLADQSSNNLLFGVVVATSVVIIFLSFLFDLIIMTFFANMFTRLKMIRLKFTEVFKILVYCSTIPTILTVALQLIWPSLSIGSFVLAITLIIYFNIFPKPERKKKE